MYLHKTSGLANAGNTGQGKAKNVSSLKTSPAVPAEKPAAQVTAQRTLSSLISAAGLPSDKLSASIVLFARFFSLPVKPDAMAAIRRQAFTQSGAQEVPQDSGKPQSVSQNQASAFSAKMREAFSMSAAAAESKGVELQPKGLESFAEAIDPDLRDRQNQADDGRRKNQNKNQSEQEDEKSVDKIDADSLKKMALENAEQDPLLFIMNRLQNKNGQRWIVIPFDFSQNEKDYRVSMRILLEPEHAVNHSAYMALDVVESDSRAPRRSLFVLEAANSKIVKLSVYLQSENPGEPQAQHQSYESIKNELSKLLEIPAEKIAVKASPDSFLCSACGEDILPSIDEAV